MKTIGSRLTLLYVASIAGMVLSIFLLGRFLLERQMRGNLDSILAARFADVSDRLLADPDTDLKDLSALLPAPASGMPFNLAVSDRWTDPAYRAARLRGEVPPDATARRFFDEVRAPQERVRTMEGNVESLQIRLSTPLAPLDNSLRAFTRTGLAIIGAVLALSVVAGRLLSLAALRPLRLIQETAARIGSGNLGERIPISGATDEISSLALLLNQTFDRLEASFEQINRFSEEASHEIKTPLSLIRLNVERLAGRDDISAPWREALQDSIEEVHRLDKLVERLLFLSRAQAGEVALLAAEQDPRPFIASFSQDAVILAEAAGVGYVEAANESGRVLFDASHLRQVLFNLLANALRATAAPGRVTVRSEFRDGFWRVTMEDDGIGLPAEKCEAIFERFVRIDPHLQPSPARGAGLGLAICRSIIELHHGRIYAEPKTGSRGLRVIFALPGHPAGV